MNWRERRHLKRLEKQLDRDLRRLLGTYWQLTSPEASAPEGHNGQPAEEKARQVMQEIVVVSMQLEHLRQQLYR